MRGELFELRRVAVVIPKTKGGQVPLLASTAQPHPFHFHPNQLRLDFANRLKGGIRKFKRGQPAVLANDGNGNPKDFALVINGEFGGSRNIRLFEEIRECAKLAEVHHLCDYILPAFLMDDDELVLRHERYYPLRTPFVLICHQVASLTVV